MYFLSSRIETTHEEEVLLFFSSLNIWFVAGYLIAPNCFDRKSRLNPSVSPTSLPLGSHAAQAGARWGCDLRVMK